MLITILMVLLVIIAFLSFNHTLQNHMQQEISQRLQESVEPNLISFRLQMQEQIKKVNTFAEFLGNNWDLGRDVHRSLLQSAAKNNGLLRCALAYPDGSFITNDDKNEGNVASEAFFVANMQGEFFITDPRPAVVDPTKRVILFAAPVRNAAGQVAGSVIYSYLCDDFDKIFNLKAMNGEMNIVIVKANGEMLIGTSEHAAGDQNLLEQLWSNCNHQKHPGVGCLELVGDRGSLIITPDGDASAIYLRYDKLDYNDWYMVSTSPEHAAAAGIDFATRNQRQLSILLVVILSVYLGLLLLLGLLQHKMVDSETGTLTLYAFKRQARRIFRNRSHDNYVVIKLDIKDFKLINRIYTFATGDLVVKNMALALQAVLCNSQSAVARMGIDVFVLLLPFEGEEALAAKRQQFIERFRQLMDAGFSAKVMFPTGQYVLKPGDFPKPDMDEILEKVNFAHRAAKQKSDDIIDYEEDIERAALFEKTIEDRMESAIASGEFTLYLQPKVRLRDEQLCGAEALVRWKVGDRYFMYPTDFVPVFEKNGFIVQLDKYMFSCAAAFVRSCIDHGRPPIPISVNFSRHHMNNVCFVDELCAIADRYNVPHRYLEIELTESAFLGHADSMVPLITELHAHGFLISMDDFGSGYSCFAQLKDLAVDIIKIDKGFFSQSTEPRRAEIVISGIFQIAQQLGITTVAEGIEQLSQIELLRTMGCDIVQGYYYAKPMPADELNMEIDAFVEPKP